MKEKQTDIEPAYSVLSNLKYLLRELRKYSRFAAITPVFGVPAKAVAALIAVFAPKIVLDAVTQSVSPGVFAVRVGAVAVISVATAVIGNITRNAVSKNMTGFQLRHLNRIWTEKAVDMDYAAFASPSGKIKAEKARESIESNQWGVGVFLPNFVGILENLFGFLSYSAVIFTLSPLIVLLLVLSYAFDAHAALSAERWKHQSKDARAEIERRLNYIAYHTRGLGIGKDIRIYTMKSWLREMAERSVCDKRGWETKIADREYRRMLLGGALVFLRDGAAYAFLIMKLLRTDMSVGDFAMYFAAISGFGGWLSGMIDNARQLAEANNYVSDFRVFIESKDAPEPDKSAPLPCFGAPVSITLENLSFAYPGGENVLNGINLTIKAGEKLAVVGTNGSGKTTLTMLICGLLRPASGRVLINGGDSRAFRREDYFSFFTALFQDSSVLPVSIADNIALNVGIAKDYEKIHACVALAGLDEKLTSLPNGLETNLMKHIAEDAVELSGGELQKLLLARALYKDAPVILLDEPTAALDPIAENAIYLKYDSLTKGRTAVYISHRLSSTRFCDRIILLDGGKIAECGTHGELMAKGGKYAEMFELQSRYYNVH